jgi:hypothetical protein
MNLSVRVWSRLTHCVVSLMAFWFFRRISPVARLRREARACGHVTGIPGADRRWFPGGLCAGVSYSRLCASTKSRLCLSVRRSQVMTPIGKTFGACGGGYIPHAIARGPRSAAASAAARHRVDVTGGHLLAVEAACALGHHPDPVITGVGYEQVAGRVHRYGVGIVERCLRRRATVTGKARRGGSGHEVVVTNSHRHSVEPAFSHRGNHDIVRGIHQDHVSRMIDRYHQGEEGARRAGRRLADVDSEMTAPSTWTHALREPPVHRQRCQPFS